MSGYTLSQPYGKGALTQQTIAPGQWPGFPASLAVTSYACTPANMDAFRLIALSFSVATVDTMGNRYVVVSYANGPQSPIMFDTAVYAQPEDVTVNYAGGIDMITQQDGAATVNANFRLSGLWLRPGGTITVAIEGAKTDDAFGYMFFTFDRTVQAFDASQPVVAEVLEEYVR